MMALSTALLEVKAARKQFEVAGRSIVAFEDLHLRLAPGEIFCLLGPSGCGKSTLLKILAGLDALTAGSITFMDETLSRPHPQIGIVFQEDRLLPWLTVRQNVAFSLRFGANQRGVSVDDALERMGLSAFADAYPGEISGGMAQRAALARALLRDPDLLLFDEPFAALDAFHRMEMQAWVAQKLKERNAAAIFVTHDVEEALYLGDTIALMSPHPGRIVQTVTNPVSYPRRRDDAVLFDLRRDMINTLVEQGNARRLTGGNGDASVESQRLPEVFGPRIDKFGGRLLARWLRP